MRHAVQNGSEYRSALLVLLVALLTIGSITVTTIASASRLVLGLPTQRTLAIDRLPGTLPCHSHNDYWQRMPLQSALSSGCGAVEVDVWAYRNELYIGHRLADLRPNYTLSQVYLDRLVQIFDNKLGEDGSTGQQLLGKAKIDPTSSIVLLVDFKSSANGAWDILVRSLDGLRQNGLLSFSRNGQLVKRRLTVVATGSVAFESIRSNNPYQDIFFDAPLANMTCERYNTANSYYASTSFKKTIGAINGKTLSPTQLGKIRAQIASAHQCGLKVRYWSTPAWPMERRNRTWDLLMSEGADMLNVDDLDGAVEALAIVGR